MPQRSQSYLRLLYREAIYQASHDIHPAIRAILQAVTFARHNLVQHRHRHEDIGNLTPHRALKRRSRNPDDLKWISIDREHLSHNTRIRSKVRLPVIEAHHDDW